MFPMIDEIEYVLGRVTVSGKEEEVELLAPLLAGLRAGLEVRSLQHNKELSVLKQRIDELEDKQAPKRSAKSMLSSIMECPEDELSKRCKAMVSSPSGVKPMVELYGDAEELKDTEVEDSSGCRQDEVVRNYPEGIIGSWIEEYDDERGATTFILKTDHDVLSISAVTEDLEGCEEGCLVENISSPGPTFSFDLIISGNRGAYINMSHSPKNDTMVGAGNFDGVLFPILWKKI